MTKNEINKIEIEINPKTGKPFSRHTIWMHKHPERMEEQRIRGRSKIELEKSSMRTLKNKERLREVKRLYYQKNKNKLAKIARLNRKANVVKAHNYSTYKHDKKSYCEICGNDNVPLEIHHWNYDKPQLADTLCRECHKIQHVQDFKRWLRCKKNVDKELEVSA